MRAHRISGPFRAANANATWTTREALIVEFERDGQIGRGECAPLPGYSSETLDECETAFHALARGDAPSTLPPALAFALHAAELEAAANACATGPELHLAQLVMNAEQLAPNAEPCGATRKIKVGRDLETELALIDAAPGLVRVDANGSLGDRAAEVMPRLAERGVQFIEEPVPFGALAAIAPSPLPIALDESLQHPDGEERLERALNEGWAHLAVLKPAALGPRRTIRLAEIAIAHGVPIVVSHLFNGPLGYAAEAHWALRFGSPQLAQGLGRHGALDAYAGWSTDLGSDGMLRPWKGNRWPVQTGARP
ncbi:MAG: enolase C-terminal domain-like protein [Myxococcota bacterium]